MTSEERVSALLQEGERLLWAGPRWRGPLAYVKERPFLLIAVALLLVRSVLRLVLADVGQAGGAARLLQGYGALDVAAVAAAGWFAYEVVALQRVHFFVTHLRVGATHLGGATWREGHPTCEVRERRGRVTLDWGKAASRMRLGDETLEEPVPARVRFVLDEEAGRAAQEALRQAREEAE